MGAHLFLVSTRAESCPPQPPRAPATEPPRQGIVTQVTDVKPLASVITYTDDDGGTELYQEVLGRWGGGGAWPPCALRVAADRPPHRCLQLQSHGRLRGWPGGACQWHRAGINIQTHNALRPPLPRSFVPIEAQRKPDGSKWVTAPTMQTKGSKFVKFQEARLQVGRGGSRVGCAASRGVRGGRACAKACDALGPSLARCSHLEQPVPPACPLLNSRHTTAT
jgi:hypothetical protein